MIMDNNSINQNFLDLQLRDSSLSFHHLNWGVFILKTSCNDKQKQKINRKKEKKQKKPFWQNFTSIGFTHDVIGWGIIMPARIFFFLHEINKKRKQKLQNWHLGLMDICQMENINVMSIIVFLNMKKFCFKFNEYFFEQTFCH